MQVQKIKKYWWIALPTLPIVFLCVAYLFPLHLLFFGDCGNDVVAEYVTPDKGYIATVFVRGCGATTSFNTVVNVRPSWADFRGDDEYDGVFVAEGRGDLRARWESNDRLKVTYLAADFEVYKKVVLLGDIKISFEEKEDAAGGL